MPVQSAGEGGRAGVRRSRRCRPLFDAIGVDFGLVPAEVVAHEVLARIANPVIMRFLPQVPHQGEQWSVAMDERLVETCGEGAPDLWLVALDEDAHRVAAALARGRLRLGDLLRNPADRESQLQALTERAKTEGRSKQEVARGAIHAYLTDRMRRIEDLEVELAMARYQLRKQLGEVAFVSQAEARASLGLPPAPPHGASA